jgi:hypothetical protein
MPHAVWTHGGLEAWRVAMTASSRAVAAGSALGERSSHSGGLASQAQSRTRAFGTEQLDAESARTEQSLELRERPIIQGRAALQ